MTSFSSQQAYLMLAGKCWNKGSWSLCFLRPLLSCLFILVYPHFFLLFYSVTENIKRCIGCCSGVDGNWERVQRMLIDITIREERTYMWICWPWDRCPWEVAPESLWPLRVGRQRGRNMVWKIRMRESKPKSYKAYFGANCWQQQCLSVARWASPPLGLAATTPLPSSLVLKIHKQSCRCQAMLHKHTDAESCWSDCIRCLATGFSGDVKSQPRLYRLLAIKTSLNL